MSEKSDWMIALAGGIPIGSYISLLVYQYVLRNILVAMGIDFAPDISTLVHPWTFFKILFFSIGGLLVGGALISFGTPAGKNYKMKLTRLKDMIVDPIRKFVTARDWFVWTRGKMEGVLPQIITEDKQLYFTLTNYMKREQIFGSKSGAVEQMFQTANQLENASVGSVDGTIDEFINLRSKAETPDDKKVGFLTVHKEILDLLNELQYITTLDDSGINRLDDGDINSKIKAVNDKIDVASNNQQLLNDCLITISAKKVLEAFELEVRDQYFIEGDIYAHSYLFDKIDVDRDGKQLPHIEVDGDGKPIQEIAANFTAPGRRIRKSDKDAIDSISENPVSLPLSQITTKLKNEWESFLRDLKRGEYHPFSRSLNDYKDHPPVTEITDATIQRVNQPSSNSPAIDRRALFDPGHLRYWGKTTWNSADVDQSSTGNPDPMLSTSGMSKYLAQKIQKYAEPDTLKELRYFVGENATEPGEGKQYTNLRQVAEAKKT